MRWLCAVRGAPFDRTCVARWRSKLACPSCPLPRRPDLRCSRGLSSPVQSLSGRGWQRWCSADRGVVRSAVVSSDSARTPAPRRRCSDRRWRRRSRRRLAVTTCMRFLGYCVRVSVTGVLTAIYAMLRYRICRQVAGRLVESPPRVRGTGSGSCIAQSGTPRVL